MTADPAVPAPGAVPASWAAPGAGFAERHPGVAERDVEAGGVRLRIAEAGAGGRPLLVVHGFCGAKEDFTGWLGPLAERGWHAVAPDLRGHGGSEQPAEESAYSLGAIAADLHGLLDALGWDRAAILGHSMGGMAAQVAVLDDPGRWSALVLMDTSHGPVGGVDPDLLAFGVAIARAEGIEAVMAAQDDLGDEAPLTTPAYDRLVAARPDYLEFCDAKMRSCSAAMWAAMAPALTSAEGNGDRLSRLCDLQVPTLVVVGEHDEPFLDPSRALAEAIPGARLEVIPGGGHSPQFEAPEAWWAALTAFLDRQ